MENKENNLLKRISELEKSLESLEERSGLLNDEIKNVKGAITALKSDAGIEVKKAAAPEYIEVSSEIVAAQQAAPKSSVAEPPKVQENPRVLKRQQKVAERMAAREARRNAAAERREGVSLEQFIGRNAMGIGASILVFIAMIMFATLLMPYLGRELKCAAMYIFSFILIGLGEWVYRKQRNGYTILTACGVGVLYISIVATHIYFRFIDMIPLYALLLLWMACVSYLGRKRSFVFVIVGQIGIFMAILMSAYGIDTPLYLYLRFAFLLISEGLYFAVFFKSEYKYNLANTIGLMCATLAFEGLVHSKYLNYQYSANKPGVAVVLTTLIIVTIAACRLISISDNKKNAITSAVVSLVNGLPVLLVCYWLKDSMHNLGYLLSMADVPLLADSAWCYLPLTVYLAALLSFTARRANKGGFNLEVPEYIIYGGVMLSILLLPERVAPVFAAAVLLVLVVYNFSADKKKLYMVSQSAVCFGIYLFMTSRVDSIYLPLFMFVLAVAQMVYSRTQNPRRVFLSYEILSYFTTIAFMFVLASIAMDKLNTDDRFIEFCVQTLLMIALQLTVKKTDWMFNNGNKLRVYHFTNLVFMAITGWGISFAEGVPKLLLAVALAAVLFSLNLRSLIKINENFGAYIAAKYSVLLGILMFHLYVPSFGYSIVYLLIAIACVVTGFKVSNKSVRLYGLILSMISIVKLIMIDISYTNTLTRAISFLVCGLLCFGISLIYNHIDKQQKLKAAQMMSDYMPDYYEETEVPAEYEKPANYEQQVTSEKSDEQEEPVVNDGSEYADNE